MAAEEGMEPGHAPRHGHVLDRGAADLTAVSRSPRPPLADPDSLLGSEMLRHIRTPRPRFDLDAEDTATAEPRLRPAPDHEISAALSRALKPWRRKGQLPNIFRTLARNPPLLNAWLPFGSYLFDQSSLGPADRELVILRTAWRCRCHYEWRHHVRLARRAGLTEADIERVPHGPEWPGWTPIQAALIAAVDELEDTASIGDATWTALVSHADDQAVLDVIYTYGAYRTIAGAMNALRVPPDPDDSVLPAPDASRSRDAR